MRHKSPDNQGFYTFAISQRINKIYIIMIIIISICTIISVGIFFKIDRNSNCVKKPIESELGEILTNKEEHTITMNEPSLNFTNSNSTMKMSHYINNISNPTQMTIGQYSIVKEMIVGDKSKKRIDVEYSMAIHSCRFWRIIAINFLMSFFEYSLLNTYIILSSIYTPENNIKVYYTAIAMFILSALCHPLFNWLGQKCNPLMLLIGKGVIAIAISCSFYSLYEIAPVYLGYCLVSIIMNALRGTMVMRYMEIVYDDIYLFGYFNYSEMISYALSAVSAFLIPRIDNDMMIMNFMTYYIGGGLNLIGIFLILVELCTKVNSEVKESD